MTTTTATIDHKFYSPCSCELEVALLANNIIIHNAQHSSFAVTGWIDRNLSKYMYVFIFIGVRSYSTDDMKKEFEEFWASHVDRPLTARNEILAAFCPQVLLCEIAARTQSSTPYSLFLDYSHGRFSDFMLSNSPWSWFW